MTPTRSNFTGVSKQIEDIIAPKVRDITPSNVERMAREYGLISDTPTICTGCGEQTSPFAESPTWTPRGHYYDSETFCAHCKCARDRKLAIEAGRE
jgi:hypothetical protein